jgi:hypothetical protein
MGDGVLVQGATKAGVRAGILLSLLLAAAPVQAETWTADMQIDRTHSAGLCQRGALNTYTLDWTGSTLTGRSVINSFRAQVAADGTVNDGFVGELDPGLSFSVTTRMPRFTITGNARTRDLVMAWPSGPCVWTLKPRG